MPAGKPLGCQAFDNSSAANDTAARYSPLRYSSLVNAARIVGTRVARMFVHLSPRRFSARTQNSYEDGTDEDEQILLQPEDRPDRRRSASGGRRSSPQDQHPRHTQPHASSRMFADQQCARNESSEGPVPNAPVPANNAGGYDSESVFADPAHNAGEAISETSYADPAHNAGEAALPPSSLPRYQSHTRTSGAHGTYFLSTAAKQPAGTSFRADHRQHTERTPIILDPGGGRGLYSSSSEPIDEVADLFRKSTFYRNAGHTRPTRTTATPLVLPELPIQKFTGDVRLYPMFRNRFLKTVGERTDLDNCEKFQYLLQHLEGEPLRMADGYYITDVNFFKCLGRLEDLYGDTAMLATLLMQDFFKLKPVDVDYNSSELERFHGEALCLTDQMEQLGQAVNGAVVWRHTLLSKMPMPLRIKICENLRKDPNTASVQEILTSISDHARLIRRCESYTPWTTAEGTSNCGGPQCRPDPSSDSYGAGTIVNDDSLADDSSDLNGPQCREDPEPTSREPAVQRVPPAVDTTIADVQLQERRTCPLCSRLHSAADCTDYVTTNRRLRRAMKLNLCLLCLREGHPAVSCPRRTTRPCNICRRGQHNRAFCKDADDDKRRKDRRPSQVRATRKSCRDPEASDPKRHSRHSAPTKPSGRIDEQPVSREATCCVATATTLRQSGTQSSRERSSGNLINRKKRTKDLGTHPPGRTGTNRPPFTSTDESIKHDGAVAYGRDRLLPVRDNHLQTDTRSTTREMMQFDRTQLCDGTDGALGRIPDEAWTRELFNDEDASHQPSDGPLTDTAPDCWSVGRPDDGFPPNEESTAYVACASDSDEQPAVLHECLAVTAMNPASKKSRRAVIMFDSGATYSHLSSKLAHDLDLPHPETRVQNVSTFGSKTQMAINGFRTFLVLRSAHGRCLQVNVTVVDCIVSSVRTALISNTDLPALRRSDCIPTSTREMPDLLIGQDMMHLFDRRLKPTLPSGFYVVRTSMGPTIGGASRSVSPPTKASQSSCPPAAILAADDTAIAYDPSRWSHSPSPSKPKRSTSRYQPRLSEVSVYRPAHNAGDTADSSSDATRVRPAHNAGETVVRDNNKCLEPSTSTSFVSRQPSSLPRVSGALPRSPRKQFFTNPLDTKPLLLPTSSTTYVEVEEVPAAHNAAGLPRPIQTSLSTTEADLRRSILPTPTRGNLIRALPYDAGSLLLRTTLLRCRPPVNDWQTLGIYAAREPVSSVTLLRLSDSTFVLPRDAECGHRFVLMAPLLPQITIILRTSLEVKTSQTSDFVDIPLVPRSAPPAHNAGGQACLAAPSATLEEPAHNAGALEPDSGPSKTLNVDDPLVPKRAPPAHNAGGQASLASSSTTIIQAPRRIAKGNISSVEIHVFTDGSGHAHGFNAYLRVYRPASEDCAVLLPNEFAAAVFYGLLRSALRPHADVNQHCAFEWSGSRHDCLRWLRYLRSLPTHAREVAARPPQGSAHPQPPARSALNTIQHSGPQPTPRPLASQPVGPPPACLPPPLPASASSRVRIDPHPTRSAQGPAAETLHCCPLCLPTPAARRISSRFSALVHLCMMVRRKPNKIATVMDFPAVPPGSTFHRVHKSTSSSLLNEPTMNDRQRASVPAHNAGLMVSATRTRAKAKTSVTPAHNAGSQAIAKDAGRTPGRCKTPPSTTPQVTTTKPAQGPAKPRKLGASRLPAPAKEKRSSATAKPAAQAKPPAKKLLKPSPGHRAHTQASPSGPQCRSVNLSCGISGHSRGSGPQCRSSRTRTREPAQASPRVLTAAAPPNCRRRGPRADRFDQELPAAFPLQAASNYFPTTLRRATRATQEPLELQAPATVLTQTVPPLCAFCGQLHQSRECDIYATVAQRIRRTRLLKLCFSCLGQDHRSSSCWQNASVCTACYAGQHNEAFCRHVATTPSAHGGAPTVTAPVAAAPSTEHSRRSSSTPPATTNLRRACAFCQSAHWSAKCTAYAGVSQRLRRARMLELCFVCLRNGHHATSCPSGSKPCMFCSTGRHHQTLCRRALTRSSDAPADGTKRVNNDSVHVNDRNDCSPKNETICFCDASTFQQFGRQLRSGVQMISTPTSTPADESNFVFSFRPTSEVKRVIFWFGSDSDPLNHVKLVRLVTELSNHYTTHYESIVQYVVVSPSASSRQDAWTYGIFKYLVHAQVLLPDARLSMLPHDLLVQDHNDHQTMDMKELPPSRRQRDGTADSPSAIDQIKHCLREQFDLDLWSSYHGAYYAEPATIKVAAHNAASEIPSTACESLAAAHNAVASVPVHPPILASTAKQNPCVQDSKAATDARASTQLPATPDAATSSSSRGAPNIAAPAASQAVPAPATDIEARIAQLSADLAALKGLLPKPTVKSGHSAPTRPPDTTPEKDD